jgi:tRNA(Ile2) C34 agmatinyltransferase TiaS
MDFIKIAKAWIAAYNPTEKQTLIAEERHKICNECPSNVKSGLWDYKCNECGCPISKKIFSDQFNDCPLGKWESVDSQHFPPRKVTKTLF